MKKFDENSSNVVKSAAIQLSRSVDHFHKPHHLTAAIVENVENFARQELQRLNAPSSGPSFIRAKVYSECFGMLVEHFQFCRGLMNQIKIEIDLVLDQSQQQAQEHSNLKERIMYFDERTIAAVREIVDHYSAAIHKARSERDLLEKMLIEEQNKAAKLQSELLHAKHSRENLFYSAQRSEKRLNDALERNDLLQGEVLELRKQVQDYEKLKVKAEKMETEVRELQLEKDRENQKVLVMQDVEFKLTVMNVRYNDQCQKNKRLRSEITGYQLKLQDERQKISKETARLTRLIKESFPDIFPEVLVKMPATEALKASLSPKATTPTHVALVDEDQLNPAAATFYDTLKQIGNRIDYLGNLLTLHLPGLVLNKMGSDSEDPPFFVTLGTSESVPPHLRYQEERVKSLNLSKRQTETVVKQIWRSKTQDGRGAPMSEYTNKYIKKNFEASAAQWAYSFNHALTKYKSDADIALFLSILKGDLHEDIYWLQDELVAQVQSLATALPRKHGLVSRNKLFKQLSKKMAFAAKRLRELEQALIKDQGDGKKFSPEKLFEEDEELNQGSFADALRKGTLEDRLQQLATIESELVRLTNALENRGDTLVVSFPAIIARNVLASVFPGALESDIIKIITWCAAVDLAEDQGLQELMIPSVSLFMQRLRSRPLRIKIVSKEKKSKAKDAD